MSPLLNNLDHLIQANPALAFVAVFLAGVLVSFTPCVYPVIPLTLGFIGARSAGSRWKGFVLSLFYVLGMALMYAVLGLFASLSGKLFGAVGSHPVTYFIVANVCLFLGLSMLGVLRFRSYRSGPAFSFRKKRGILARLSSVFFRGLLWDLARRRRWRWFSCMSGRGIICFMGFHFYLYSGMAWGFS